MKEFEFKKCLKIGNIGENIVIGELVRRFSKNYHFEYVGDMKEYQDIDVDLLMTNKKTGEITKIEIKTDMTDYENIFAELVSSEEKGTPGCWLKTESDFIIYYFQNKNTCYIIPTQQGRDIALNGGWRTGRAYDKLFINGVKCRKTSIGALIPIKNLLEKIILDDTIFKDKYFNIDREMILNEYINN